MATLTRPKIEKLDIQTSNQIGSSIPAPFPRAKYEQTRETIAATIPSADQMPEVVEEPVAGPSRISDSELHAENKFAAHDILPSIISVQKSSVMALNSLLSVSENWSPIVPGRRHSLPSVPQVTTESEPTVVSSSSALQTLVANLRNRDSTRDMIEYHSATNDDELIHELRTRVEHISKSLDGDDAQLATSLVSLLAHLNRLSKLQKSSAISATAIIDPTSAQAAGPSDLFNVLKRQLSDLRTERVSLKPELADPAAPPVKAVESALLWHKIDEDLEIVMGLCKERSENIQRHLPDYLPPEYEKGEYEHDTLPEYDYADSRMSIDSSKSRISLLSASTHHADEKMRMDLENVSMAIERLYLVAPQLHNQRAELKTSKRVQLEQASREGSRTPKSRHGKQREQDIGDLDEILNLLGKASERKLHDQVVTLDHNHSLKLEQARQRDIVQRDQFVENLARHSQAGRLHGQDATFGAKVKNPEALLSLPEFIREPVPQHLRYADPSAMLTLPEFVKEPLPEPRQDPVKPAPFPEQKPAKKLRNRSSSAPSLQWLFSASGRMSPHHRSRSRNVIEPVPPLPINAFEVHHIAENHENLQHIIIFFIVTGSTLGVDLEAEVIPIPGSGNHLLITSGVQRSVPLPLPASVQPGPQVLKVQGEHYEVKIPTLRADNTKESPSDVSSPLLDAAQLSSANPSTFICASCSLPIVQSSTINQYRDLPSEHWAELVDAWMCHTDQKLHDQIVKNSKAGFWPSQGEALVGGSYILFQHAAIASNNIHTDEAKSGDGWQLVRCLCGAVLGRSQQEPNQDAPERKAYRLLKFAIRPVSLASPPLKIPLSAFVAQDMIELSQAHASYRFVIADEEEETPRMLVWLFKPSIRISYTTSMPYTIPKSGTINAAKVLYKVLTPAERNMDIKDILNKYPGFPQAEYLFYPMPICRRLAQLLRESNGTYPKGMQEMMNLKLGWLSRV